MNNYFSPEGIHSPESRLRHLEEQARFTLDVLEMASTLGDFQTSINKLHDPTALLDETIQRIGGLVHFATSAFYLVDENSSDFTLTLCDPESFRGALDEEVQHLIDNGVFALAVRENRPVTVYSRDNQYRLVLHVLATASRTRGMFVGVMSKGERNLSGIIMSLLSIVLKHCANAIESFELYRLFRQGEHEATDFVESLDSCVFEVDMHYRITYANAAAQRQGGFIAGRHLSDCVPEAGTTMWRLIESALAGIPDTSGIVAVPCGTQGTQHGVMQVSCRKGAQQGMRARAVIIPLPEGMQTAPDTE